MIDTTNAGYTPRALDYVRRFNAAEVTVSKLREDQRASRAFAAELRTDAELENTRLFDALADETGIEIDAALADAKSSIDCLVAMTAAGKYVLDAAAAIASAAAVVAAAAAADVTRAHETALRVYAVENFARATARSTARAVADAAMARACED